MDLAFERVSIRERLERVRRAAPRILMVAVAAGAAYAIARYAFGHDRPFFAPIAAVIVLGVTFGQTTQRAIQLAIGVTLGILVADVVIQLIGTGGWQLVVIVFAAMCVAVFAGGDQLAVNQAAAAGVLIATFALPGDAFGLGRAIDALVGASVAIVFNVVLFPINPLKLAQGALEPTVRRIAAALDAAAGALESRDDAAAAAALEQARSAEGRVDDLRVAVGTSGETARLALLRRGQRDAVARYERAVDQVARLQHDVAGLVNGARRAIEVGDPVPPDVIAAVRELAVAVRHLQTALLDDGDVREVREAAERAAFAATAGLDRTRNLSVSVVVIQTRMAAGDLLRATGMRGEDARRAVRSADDQDTGRAAAAAEAMQAHGMDAEIEAARPAPPDRT